MRNAKEFFMDSKKTISRIGFIYGAFALLLLVIQIGASFVLRNYFYDFTVAHAIELSLALTFVGEHIICFGIFLLIIRKVQGETIEKRKLGVGMAIAAFFIMYALMEAGALIGNAIQLQLTGGTENDATELMMQSSIIPRVFVIGIAAPIVEELLFRKFLIDRLIKYGAVFSMIMSGIMFGLIHANFSQFFYAFLLGAFFAAIYIMTGNIKYTIVYHMIVNISSSVIGVYVLEDFANKGTDSIPYMIYSVFILLSAIVGVVFLIIKAKDFWPKENRTGEEVVCKPASGLLSAGMIFYFVMMVVMFLVTYDVISI